MIRYKTKNQAFIIAALLILLCIVCLTGATLALFTNDPSGGTIGIITTSGHVDVDLIDEASGRSLEGEALQFYSSSAHSKVIFEPGATFATQGFKIVNRGNVPINYTLRMGKDDVVDINGQPIDIEKFNENFEIFITNDRNDLTFDNSEEAFKGSLGCGEGQNTSETYYLVVRMKDTAGNEFQKQTYSGIGITVYAVQGNANSN